MIYIVKGKPGQGMTLRNLKKYPKFEPLVQQELPLFIGQCRAEWLRLPEYMVDSPPLRGQGTKQPTNDRQDIPEVSSVPSNQNSFLFLCATSP